MKLLKSFASIGSFVKNVDYKKFDYFNDDSNRHVTIHYSNGQSIQIVAQSDWGISYIVKLKGMPFSKLNNKIIKSIKEIKNKQKIKDAFLGIKPVDITDDPDHADHECNKFHLYEMKLDDNTTFNFGLINASNGYYDGWIEIVLL